MAGNSVFSLKEAINYLFLVLVTFCSYWYVFSLALSDFLPLGGNLKSTSRDVPGSIFLPSTGYRVIRRFFAESGYRVM